MIWTAGSIILVCQTPKQQQLTDAEKALLEEKNDAAPAEAPQQNINAAPIEVPQQDNINKEQQQNNITSTTEVPQQDNINKEQQQQQQNYSTASNNEETMKNLLKLLSEGKIKWKVIIGILKNGGLSALLKLLKEGEIDLSNKNKELLRQVMHTLSNGYRPGEDLSTVEEILKILQGDEVKPIPTYEEFIAILNREFPTKNTPVHTKDKEI